MHKADLQHLFAYHEWANKLIWDAVENLPAEQLHHDFKSSHGSVFGTLLHNAAAEWVWLERWRGQAPTVADWQQWQAEHGANLATLQSIWQVIAENRRIFLDNVDEAQLAADLPYKLTSGSAGCERLAHLMQHVANHATLHRGQIMGMLRQLGLKPPATDLLFYLREMREA